MVQKYFLGAICLIAFYIANADDGHKCGCVVQGLPENVCQEIKNLYNCEDTINLKEKYKWRNVLIYKGKYYINNFYPVLDADERYLQLADILQLTGMEDVKQRLINLEEQLNLYHKLKGQGKEISQELEEGVKTEALFFTKVLFTYIKYFATSYLPVPDFSNTENLDDILNIDKQFLAYWKNFLTPIKNLKLSNLFRGQNNANRFLHTEFLLYYRLQKTDSFSFPLYFVSYLHMCKNCETFWAQKTTYEEGKYNVICISKKEPESGIHTKRKKEEVNNSFLQIRYK